MFGHMDEAGDAFEKIIRYQHPGKELGSPEKMTDKATQRLSEGRSSRKTSKVLGVPVSV